MFGRESSKLTLMVQIPNLLSHIIFYKLVTNNLI